MFVKVDGHAKIRYADLDDVHRRFDRAAHCAFGDAISGQDLGLSFGCASAVRSHCGYDIGNGTNGFHFFDDGFDDGVDVGNAAAARGYGNGLTGFDHRTGIDSGDFLAHSTGDVIDARSVKVLANAEHLRVSRHGVSSCCDFLSHGFFVKGDYVFYRCFARVDLNIAAFHCVFGHDMDTFGFCTGFAQCGGNTHVIG